MDTGKLGFLVLMYLGALEAAETELECSNLIFGCGEGVFGFGQDACCTCLEHYPTTDSLPVFAACINLEALEITGTCCPCVNPPSPLSEDSDFLACVDPTKARIFTTRFEGTRQFIRDAVRGCNGHLRDDCAPPNFNHRLREMIAGVNEAVSAIEEDCDFSPPFSSESDSDSDSESSSSSK